MQSGFSKIFAGFKSLCMTLHMWIKAKLQRLLYISFNKWFSENPICILRSWSMSESKYSSTMQIFKRFVNFSFYNYYYILCLTWSS